MSASDVFRLCWTVCARLSAGCFYILDRIRDANVKVSPRSAATTTLLGVILSASMAFALFPRAATVAVAQANRPAESSPSFVKMVDGVPRSKVCAEQTWPYIDSRCLRAAGPRVSAQSNSRPPNAEPASAGQANLPASSATQTNGVALVDLPAATQSVPSTSSRSQPLPPPPGAQTTAQARRDQPRAETRTRF
jgi:hypothetical protein